MALLASRFAPRLASPVILHDIPHSTLLSPVSLHPSLLEVVYRGPVPFWEVCNYARDLSVEVGVPSEVVGTEERAFSSRDELRKWVRSGGDVASRKAALL